MVRWSWILAAALASGGIASGAKERKPSYRPYPLYCAGITVGMSTDEDVRRMYGNGLFASDEGHGGGRYYVDPRHQVTLHVETGVDRVIETVSLIRGVELPKNRMKSGAVPPEAVAPRLTAKEHIDLGFRINAGAEAVLRQWGKPQQDSKRGKLRIIRYVTDYQENPYVLFYEAEFHFKENRLTSVRLYNGE